MPYADRDTRLQFLRDYRKNNAKLLKEKRDNQRDHIQRIQNLHRLKNLYHIRARQRAWYKKTCSIRPWYKVRNLLRDRINKALHGAIKSSRSVCLLGMEIPEYRIYLQGQFRPGMVWENHGKVWHIDHIRPCASFDLTKPEQQQECFNWSNTQPLFVRENLKKGRKNGF